MPLTPWHATVDPRLHRRLPDTHRQVWLSLLWGHCSFLLACTRFCCALQESVSPVLGRYCNQILLVFKVKLKDCQSRGLSVPLPIPQVGKSVVGPRIFATVRELLWYNCFQVVGCLLSYCMVGLMVTSSKRTYATCHASQDFCSQSPCPHVATADLCVHRSKAGLAQSLWGLWVQVHTRFCLSPLSVSGRYGV